MKRFCVMVFTLIGESFDLFHCYWCANFNTQWQDQTGQMYWTSEEFETVDPSCWRQFGAAIACQAECSGLRLLVEYCCFIIFWNNLRLPDTMWVLVTVSLLTCNLKSRSPNTSTAWQSLVYAMNGTKRNFDFFWVFNQDGIQKPLQARFLWLHC